MIHRSHGAYDVDNNIFDKLYYFLWQKDFMTREGHYSVNIPETVIFKDAVPYLWFFTSKNGTFLMKKLSSSALDEIYDRFYKKKSSKLDIIAQYMYQEKDEADAEVTVFYIKEENFKNFLTSKNKPKNGILQQFIIPLGQNQTTIQVIWSPTICLFTKRQNLKNLYETNYDAYGNTREILFQERCTTFDGPHILSSHNSQVCSKITQDIRQQIEHIVMRISNSTYNKLTISRGVFYFKCDQNQKLWFLYTTSLRFKDDVVHDLVMIKEDEKSLLFNCQKKSKNIQEPLKLENFKYEHIDHTFSIHKNHPAKLELNKICLNCNKKRSSKNFKPLTYLMLHNYHENYLKLSQRQKENYQIKDPLQEEILQKEIQKKVYSRTIINWKNFNSVIPPAIQAIETNLQQAQYKELIQETHFQKQSVEVCVPCYLRIFFVDKKQVHEEIQKIHGTYNYFTKVSESNKYTIKKIQDINRQLNESRQYYANQPKYSLNISKEKIVNEKIPRDQDIQPIYVDHKQSKRSSYVDLLSQNSTNTHKIRCGSQKDLLHSKDQDSGEHSFLKQKQIVYNTSAQTRSDTLSKQVDLRQTDSPLLSMFMRSRFSHTSQSKTRTSYKVSRGKSVSTLQSAQKEPSKFPSKPRTVNNFVIVD